MKRLLTALFLLICVTYGALYSYCFFLKKRPYNIIHHIATCFLDMTRFILRIKTEIQGIQHLPPHTPFIIAAKHQSVMEIAMIAGYFSHPHFILKHELMRLPIFGKLMKKDCIAINRSDGMKSLKVISEKAKKIMSSDSVFVIFPQGTRVKPGQNVNYKRGVINLYKDLQLPIVPVAVNTYKCWPKGLGSIKSGTVSIRFLPFIPPGQDENKVLKQLKEVIEQNTDEMS